MWLGHNAATPPLSAGHHIARTGEELAHMVRCMRSAPFRAFDFETNGLRYRNPDKHAIGYGVGFIASDGRPYSWYVPVKHRTNESMADPVAARRAFRDALEGAEGLIGHHLKYDLNVARSDGWDVSEDVPLHDTLVQGHLCYEKRPFKLELLVESTRGIDLTWAATDMSDRHADFLRDRAKLHRMAYKRDKPGEYRQSYLSKYGHSEVPVGLEAEYCCRDIDHTLVLDTAQRREAMGIGTAWEARRRHLYENEMLLTRALADMEYEGQPIDADYLRRVAAMLDEDLDRRGKLLCQMFGVSINFGNDNQVRDLLYEHLKLTPPGFTEKGLPSVDRASLALLQPYHPAIEHLAAYSVRYKVRSTYTHSLAFRQDADGRVHGSFLQQGTATGRLSARDPNLQNIPMRDKEMSRLIREAFPVMAGMSRVYSDYSQVELRMLSWVTGCRNLAAAYHSPAYVALLDGQCSYDQYLKARALEPEIDAHGNQAIASLGAKPTDSDWKLKRRCAKVINFGVPYGMSHVGLMGHPDLLLPEPQAREFFENYHAMNSEIDHTKNRLFRKMRNARGTPYFVNWAGRKVHEPKLRSAYREEQGSGERAAFASLIQGSAAELTRFSIVACWKAAREGRLPAKATSTVHDEIQFDCATSDVLEVGRIVREIMEDSFRGRFGVIPVVADLEVTETNWADKRDLDI